jgi:hypothetical protein
MLVLWGSYVDDDLLRGCWICREKSLAVPASSEKPGNKVSPGCRTRKSSVPIAAPWRYWNNDLTLGLLCCGVYGAMPETNVTRCFEIDSFGSRVRFEIKRTSSLQIWRNRKRIQSNVLKNFSYDANKRIPSTFMRHIWTVFYRLLACFYN